MTEPASTAPTDPRESRAREWIRALTDFPERFAGSHYERAAAEQVAGWMRDLGLTDVSVVPAPGGPRPGLALALHAGLALIGCALGGLIGVVLAFVAVYSFRREYRARRPLLTRLLPAQESVNVIGRNGNRSAQRRVILTAHIDTTQAGWMFSRNIAGRFAGVARSLSRGDGDPQPPHALPEVLLMGAAILALAAWLGAHGFLFGLMKLIVGVALLVTVGLGLQWAASRATPGANDNASAVAAMLTCAERLKAALPDDVELWVAGTGAEETGHGGMHSIVGGNRAWPLESTFYVNFECTGGGALNYIVSEGMLSKVVYPPTLIELARRVAAGGAFGEVTPTRLLAGTDGNVPAREGYPTLSLISLEANGVPRNYHRIDDTVDGIDLSMVVRAADFGTAVAVAGVNGDAGPLRVA